MKSNRQQLKRLLERHIINDAEKEMLQDMLAKDIHSETRKELQVELENVMKIDAILYDSEIKLLTKITL